MAFRRADYRRRAARSTSGSASTATSTSGGASSCATKGRGSRRAGRCALDGLPVVRHEHRGWTSLPDEERDRQSKRNFYRIIDRFGSRRDLLVSPGVGLGHQAAAPDGRPVRPCPSTSQPARLDLGAQRVGAGEVARRPRGRTLVDERRGRRPATVVAGAVGRPRRDRGRARGRRRRRGRASAARRREGRRAGSRGPRRAPTAGRGRRRCAATNRSWRARPAVGQRERRAPCARSDDREAAVAAAMAGGTRRDARRADRPRPRPGAAAGAAHGPSAGGGPSARSRARSDVERRRGAVDRRVGVVELARVARGQDEVAERERVDARARRAR